MRNLLRSCWLYAVTVRYLKPGQLLWRIWYRLIWWPTVHQLVKVPTPARAQLGEWRPAIVKPQSCFPGPVFTFLNREVDFGETIDWQYDANGRLWTYNLHYFDFLNATSESAPDAGTASDEIGNRIIQHWIDNNPPTTGTGWEPYPVSLRVVNWIKWTLDGHSLSHAALESLFIQARWLSARLEHHILANHLFTNLKALCFAGVYFDGPEAAQWQQRALTLLQEQLDEQILPDGAHFELSPMYHDIMLEDLLDLINLLSAQQSEITTEMRDKLCDTASRMLGWSLQTRHPDGQIAFFNDAAFSIAPDIESLSTYAARLSIAEINTSPDSAARPEYANLTNNRSHSGLTILRNGNGFAVFDAGPIGPDYQPGHAHADSLSFEYSWGSDRIFVNSGTSTYTPGALRELQRSTRLHNTVEIDSTNSSDVWGGFRVAGRARTRLLDAGSGNNESGQFILASHNGYSGLTKNVIHTRKLQLDSNGLQVEDQLSGDWDTAIGRLYLHPSAIIEGDDRLISCSGQVFVFTVTGGYLTVCESNWYPEFGRQVASHCLEFHFSPEHTGHYRFQLSTVNE